MIDMIRRDPALRSLTRWLLIAPLFASMLEGLRTLSYFNVPASDAGPVTQQMILVALSLWLPLSGFLLFGRVGQRCSRLDLGLPIPALRLWQVHLAAALVAGLALVLSEFAVIWLRRTLVSGLAPGIAASFSDGADPFLPTLATMVLGVIVLQIPHVDLYSLQAGKGLPMAGLFMVAGGFGLILLLSALPWFASVAVLVVSLVLAAGLQRRLPAAFVMVPREASLTTVNVPGASWTTGSQARDLAVGRQGTWGAVSRGLTVLRIYSGSVAPGQMVQVPATLLGIPVIFAWGLLLSGLIISQEASFMFLTLSSYILFAFVPAQASQIYLLDALPISRRALFAGLVLPALVILGAGYSTGALVKSRSRPAAMVELQAERTRLFPRGAQEHATVRVPYIATRIAWTREAPILEAPWGETHPAWSETLVRDGSLRLYSPYATPEKATPAFQALMISRALNHIYGRHISPDEIQERYLENGHSDASLAGGLSTLLADYPDLGTPLSPRLAPLYFMITTLLFLLMVAIYTRALRANVTNTGRKVAMFSLLGAIFFLHVLQLTLAMANLLEIDVLGAMAQIGSFNLVNRLPGGQAGLWILCILITTLGYGWAESRFRRIEAPLGSLCRSNSEEL
jgi:hypothetical protein